MKIILRFLIIIMLSYFAVSCGPGDGSTLNPLGEPLGPPELGINVTEIEVTLEEGKTTSISVQIKNTGGFPLELADIRSNVAWMSLDNVSFPLSIEAGDSVQISVNIGDPTLLEGSYQGKLQIISNDNDMADSEFGLTVKLSITPVLPFEPTLSTIQARIFNFVCTECHNSSNPPEGLNLSRGNSFTNLVNRRSNQVPGLFLVEPFNPDESYLIRKLEGGANIVEERMPLEQPPLSSEWIRVVRVWISQGAQDN